MEAAIGIDVSRDWLDAALVVNGGERPQWCLRVERTPAGVETLLQKTPPGVAWVMEPTGRYSQDVALWAREVGQPVLLATAKAARHALLAVRTATARTDRTDSIGLAMLAHLRRLRPYPLRTERMEEIDQLIKTRRALSATQSRLREQRQSLPRAARCFDAPLAAVAEQIAALDRELAQCAAQESELAVVPALLAIPGIGPVTALTVASCLEAKQFDHPDQFVAYCGLHLEYKDSGQKQAHRRLSKHGDAELRRLLYLAAMTNARCVGSPFREQYERERAKGLSAPGAFCAVARKLATVCWSMHRHRTSYDPERVYSQAAVQNPRSTP